MDNVVLGPSEGPSLQAGKPRWLNCDCLETCEACAIERARCVDCRIITSGPGGNGEYYMVHDALWQAAGNVHGMLCLKCLDQRLGRKLTLDDFTALCPTEEAWSRYIRGR